jgi:Flp pilus assembly protein TadD
MDKAIEANQRALEVSAEFGPAHNNLALLYARKGDRESARRHLQEAERVGFPVIPELRKELLSDEET